MFTDCELVQETAKLKRFARKLSKNHYDADDLVQSALLRAMEKREQFQEGSSLFSWVAKILFNNFVTTYRQKARFMTQYDPEWYISQEACESDQETNAELAQTLAAMKGLSADHREILTLVCVKGLRYAEVSEILKVPIGTVRSRLSRARENLQVRLNMPEHTSDDSTEEGEPKMFRERRAAVNQSPLTPTLPVKPALPLKPALQGHSRYLH